MHIIKYNQPNDGLEITIKAAVFSFSKMKIQRVVKVVLLRYGSNMTRKRMINQQENQSLR